MRNSKLKNKNSRKRKLGLAPELKKVMLDRLAEKHSQESAWEQLREMGYTV